ncbi:MAG: SufB/SufD family protein [Paracoccaceae bacterium]
MNSHWIDAHTKQYEKSFKKIDMLDRKSEYWRFASPLIWHDKNFNKKLSHDKKKLSSSFNINEIAESSIRFKDGILDFDSLIKFNQSEKNVEVSSYNDAVIDESHWSRLKFGKAQLNAEKPYERPLALFNGFNAADGVFIKFKKGTKKKFHIIYEGNEHKKSIIRNLFDFEEGAEIKIIEHFYGKSKYNIVSEFFADKNSNFEHNKIINIDMAETVIYHLFGNCKKNSNVKTVNFSFSENPVRNEVNFFLEGSDCNATVASLGFGKKDTSICDNTVFISHQQESCISRQIIKNALTNGAKAIFQGKIYVSPKAQKTDGYQMSNGLILTDDCQFLVKPELEIYADDVVCSHGSISGSLNDDHLFYLQSRGIPLVEAQKKLIQAFFAEILDEIDDKNLIDHIQNQISKILT